MGEIPKNEWIPFEEIVPDNDIPYLNGKSEYKFLGCIGDICQYKRKIKTTNRGDWQGLQTQKVFCNTLDQQLIRYLSFKFPDKNISEPKDIKPLNFSSPIHQFALKICEQR